MDLKLLNEQGQAAATFSAPDTIFGRDFNEALIHQVVVAFKPTPVPVTAPRRTVPKSSTPPRSPGARRVPVALAPV